MSKNLYRQIHTLATVKVVPAYCFTVPIAFVAKAGLTLGLVIPATERFASYELFYDGISRIHSSLSHVFDELPLLSDQRLALVRFTRCDLKHHFSCSQHALVIMESKRFIFVLAQPLI
jgi:hypothetical protein